MRFLTYVLQEHLCASSVNLELHMAKPIHWLISHGRLETSARMGLFFSTLSLGILIIFGRPTLVFSSLVLALSISELAMTTHSIQN